jgi:microcystin-dependent protein
VRGRTFVHAGDAGGLPAGLTSRTLGSTFGTETVAMTEDQLPSHDHGWPDDPESRTSSVGGSQPHENVQPSIALNCVVSFYGSFPSRNLRHGATSSAATGEPTARLSSEPSIGQVSWVPYNFAPLGWAFCDGQIEVIAQNTALFALIDTLYGGDGRNTFGLPDVRSRTMVGQGRGPGLSDRRIARAFGGETATVSINELAPHTHGTACVEGLRTDALPIAVAAAADKDLSCADLTGAALETVDLRRADLTNAVLSGAQMYAVDLTDATLSNTRMVGTELTEANLTGVDLTKVDLTNSSLVNTNFTNANLTGAVLAPAVASGVIWSNTTCPDGSNSDTNGRNACP